MRLFKHLLFLFVPFRFNLLPPDDSTSGDSAPSGEMSADPAPDDSPSGDSAPTGGDVPNGVYDYIDRDGNFKEGWTKYFNINPALEQKVRSVGGLGGSYSNLETVLGKGNKVAVPNKDSTPEELALFREKMDIPVDAAGYEFSKPEDLADEAWDKDSVTKFQEIAFEHGLTPTQAQGLVNWQVKRESEALNEIQAHVTKTRDEASAVLKKEWGADYDKNMADAERAVEAAGISSETLKSKPELSNDPDYIRSMAYYGSQIKEQPTVSIRTTGGYLSIKTPQAAQAEIDRIMGDSDGPYWGSKGKVAQDNAVNEVAKLHAIVSPEPS
tara:strand:- start:14121 stop:15098 length:978 start_codon:yes stop_codon:yes gene_type:complete